MKPICSLTLAFVAAAGVWPAGCGGHAPKGRTPDSAEEAPSSTSDAADSSHARASNAGAGHASDDKEGAMKCGGFDVPDLAAVLAQASCELPSAKPDAIHTRDTKDVLEVTVKPDPARLTPGSEGKVEVVFHNKGKTDLPLDFVVDPEPRFELQVYTPKGTRIDKPAGAEPPLPSGGSDESSSDRRVARITLAAQGTATLQLAFHAVKYKWASKDRAKGALPGHGYPREPAGPLPKGKYVLRVVTPLVGVFEGSDHEVSEPRAPIEVGAF